MSDDGNNNPPPHIPRGQVPRGQIPTGQIDVPRQVYEPCPNCRTLMTFDAALNQWYCQKCMLYYKP
jgi:hypothetical protein